VIMRKSPEEIARYLPFPGSVSPQEACRTLASQGEDETPLMARGLCKTYATINSAGAVPAIDKLHAMVTAIGKSSAPAIRQAVAEIRAWLKNAPPEEKGTVIRRWPISQPEVEQRLADLEGLANAPAAPAAQVGPGRKN